MTKDELMILLRDPGQTGQAVDDLNRLIEGNPYFHTGHQLYLKGLQQTDERRMAHQLRKTALSVRDRGVLFNYLNRPSAFRQQPLPADYPAGDTSTTFAPSHISALPEAGIHNFQCAHPEPDMLLLNSPNTSGGWQNSEEHDVVAEKTKSTSSDVLIDSFLESNPKIIPNDSTFQVDLSGSLQETQDVATETLADIYATQGHKNKAIEIYEHLILKYPEKHIYFAAQIERLKE
jgi:tetratricopeptide (TPR) repeat protein